MTESETTAGPTAEAYADHLFHAGLGAFETLGVYVGDRLGWYRALADHGPATAAELSGRTDTDERYCREWLEMQAAFGTLTTDVGIDQDQRRYTLPAGPAEVLTGEHSLAYLSPFARMISAVGPLLPNLLAAYRNGGGVSWAQFGPDAREAQADINRPWFESRLVDALNEVDALREVLTAPGARIVDIGCGVGWSTIALAQGFPDATLVGLDVDAPSVETARQAAHEAGVADRIDFRLAGGDILAPAQGETEPAYDAAFLFECLHDLPHPVEMLAAVRRAVRPGGLVVVMDEAVADTFAAPAGEVDQLMYGYSLFICLPDGRSDGPSAATGTVFRRPVLEAYAKEAGFAEVEVLPIEDFAFFRFYRLLDH